MVSWKQSVKTDTVILLIALKKTHRRVKYICQIKWILALYKMMQCET